MGLVNEREALQDTLREYGAATASLLRWIAGEQALALLRTALAEGILAALVEPATTATLAARTGLLEARLADFLLALEAHAIVERDGEIYRLAPAFATLLLSRALPALPDLLGRSAVITKLVTPRDASGTNYALLTPEEALSFARSVAPDPAHPLTAALHRGLADAAPELGECWEAGARHLDLGCGAGGLLLGIAAAFPRLRAVGIELEPQIAAETRRRAEVTGLARRVEVRQGNALDLAEVDAYDSVLWAQLFFPRATRAAALAVARRALRSGGFLLVPTFVGGEPPADDATLHSAAGQAYALSRLRFGAWDIPGSSSQALCEEVAAAGFIFDRAIPFTLSSLLLFRS
jgi:SAM-dependent methyltransferase